MHHSHAQVTNNARSNLLLRALSTVLERSVHLCGSSSCLDLAYSLVLRLGWQAAALMALLLILAPNLLFMALRSLVHRQLRSKERALFEANAGRAATYENQLFWFQPPQPHHPHVFISH